MYMYIYVYIYIYLCIYIYIYIIHTAGFKKRVICNFCEIAIHFGKVFTIANHIHKMCPKKGQFCDEDQKLIRKSPKQRSFSEK